MFKFESKLGVLLFLLLVWIGRPHLVSGASPDADNPTPVGRILRFEVINESLNAEDKIDVDVFVANLNKRLHGAARVRKTGENRIEVEIPGDVDDAKVHLIRQIIGVTGKLEFRITANRSANN